MNGRPTRQRLDADDRRAAILTAARDRWAGALYPDVSVSDIAADASASPALVHHYFGSKAELYAAMVADGIAHFTDRQQEADAALPEHTPARDRVHTMLSVYLDQIAESPHSWAAPLVGGEEPHVALRLRRRARAGYIELLYRILRPDGGSRREEIALAAYLGFVDEACLVWVEGGCSEEDREPLIEACLGALEGALGDWGR